MPVQRLRKGCGSTVHALLSATWRQLAIVSYEVDPRLLGPLVPPGTELDSFGGRTLVSFVGFLFEKTRAFGIPIAADFEEVNLRFYVRREDERGVLRGVSFVREIVPRWLVATGARILYNEPYVWASMSHTLPGSYSWRRGGDEGEIVLLPAGDFEPIVSGSEEEFVAEHYYGYGRTRGGRTLEYHVTHPRWRIARAAQAQVRGGGAIFGPAFKGLMQERPVSAFLAEGSPIEVSTYRTLPESSRAQSYTR
jgi:uncharacterized protein YqjF (DUF2071 family)